MWRNSFLCADQAVCLDGQVKHIHLNLDLLGHHQVQSIFEKHFIERVSDPVVQYIETNRVIVVNQFIHTVEQFIRISSSAHKGKGKN